MADAAPVGLTSSEVQERIARGQVNRVRRSGLAEYAEIVSRNIFTLFNALVAPAAIALFWLSKNDPEALKGAMAVSGMALANTILGLLQEIRAKWHLDHLAVLSEARARVLRDGKSAEIPTGDIVMDDVVLLTSGEPIPADGSVLDARSLEVDEALLTGESDPVPRRPGDLILSGSFCVAGEGTYRVEKVGADSFANKLTREARSYRYTASPIQIIINQLLRVLTGIAIFLCGVYLVADMIRGIEPVTLVQMIAATITLMVPQGLILMATLAFILGAARMSRKGAVAQHLTAVETMAAVDTLCMDKTGTLTTSRLHLEQIIDLTPGEAGLQARHLAALLAQASPDRSSKTIQALQAGTETVDVELLDQLPFKSQNRYSAVRVRDAQEERILVLGAPDALLPFFNGDTLGWEGLWRTRLETGLRLLLLAHARTEGSPASFEEGLEGFTLEPVALLALGDELRPDAAEVLRQLAKQGISFKIISGDHPETVRATVAPLGADADEPALRALVELPIVTGDELAAASDPAELIRTRTVFGRVSPWQKVEIVKTLQHQGRVVAMIGDGVNDVLPIKNAHLGIAMGEGSRAAKTVAALVLETNRFDLLPETLEEGRTILRSLRRVSKLFLVKNVYVLILIVGALGLLRLPFPFLPQQVTLLNFLTIGLPALLVTINKERASQPTTRSFLREVGGFALHTGLALGLSGLLIFWLSAHVWGYDLATQRTLLLSCLILLGLLTMVRILSDGQTARTPGDRAVMGIAVVGMPIYLGILTWGPTRSFFELRTLDGTQWLQVLLVTVPAAAALLLRDWWVHSDPARGLTATSAGSTQPHSVDDATRTAPDSSPG